MWKYMRWHEEQPNYDVLRAQKIRLTLAENYIRYLNASKTHPGYQNRQDFLTKNVETNR